MQLYVLKMYRMLIIRPSFLAMQWLHSCLDKRTRLKISQLVAGLQTSRQQVVFARLVQVVNKFGTSC